MPTIDEYMLKVRKVFEKLVNSPEELLSRAMMVEIVGETDYQLIRAALLATEKVESAAGRAGGLVIKRAQGNRRDWGQAADGKALGYIRKYSANDETAFKDLSVIYDHWPQSQIAEALSVTQATVSNWLRTGKINPKYSEALRNLRTELATETIAEARSDVGDLRTDDTPYGDWLRAELARQDKNPIDLAKSTGIHINTILSLLQGRTEKPQQRTRERIEKALESAQVKDGGAVSLRPTDEESWDYIGLPWSEDEIEQVPEEPGVYVIHDRRGRPTYVGVAHKGKGGIRARLRSHNQNRWTADRKVASSFSYALTSRMPKSDPIQLAITLEKLLIKFMGNAILINDKGIEDLAD